LAVLNPCVSKILIRIRCAASSCGAMIMVDAKALTLMGMEEEEEGWEERRERVPFGQEGRDWQWGKQPVLLLLGITSLSTSLQQM
jgi:hypothetical protein